MKKILLILFVMVGSSHAQNSARIDVDVNEFRYKDSQNYLEVDYLIASSDTNFIQNELSHSLLRIRITKNKEEVVNKLYSLSSENNSNKKNISLLGLKRFILSPGEYNLNISLTSKDDSTIINENNSIHKIESFASLKNSISSIQLAHSISKADSFSNKLSVKNNLNILPNPSLVYTIINPVVYYYSELYNLDSNANKLIKTVTDDNGKIIYKKEKELAQLSSTIETGLFNIKDYSTGAYEIFFSIVDKNDNDLNTSKQKFYFVTDKAKTINRPVTNASYVGSAFGVYTLEECEELFQYSKYVFEDNEIDQYEKLTELNSKREFLFNQWRRRDTDLSTVNNEVLEEYLSRVDYCNQKYRAGTRSGWNTERGRVYIIYGKPDQLDRYPNEENKKPYQIWHYNNVEGGVQFVFGDISGFSDYELLHSTKRSELRNEDWMSRLETN